MDRANLRTRTLGGGDLDSRDELAANYLTFDLANHLLKDTIGDRELENCG